MNKKILTYTQIGSIAITIIIIVISFCFYFYRSGKVEVDKRIPKEVLFVSSFNDNHIWSDKFLKSFNKTLSESKYDVNITTVYLDSKNITDTASYNSIISTRLNPIKDNIDLIVGVDLEASKALLATTDSTILSKPVICASFWDPNLKITHPNGMCIKSILGIEETFIIARKMNPNAKKVYFICDSTATGQAFMAEAHRQLDMFRSGFNINFGIKAGNYEELLNKISHLGNDSFVILGTWQRGGNGKYYDPIKLYPRITGISKVPVFSIVNIMQESGFAGGYVESPAESGAALAENSISFFDGTPIKDLRLREVYSFPQFNVKALRDHNIPTGLIPENAQQINSIQYIIDANARWIIGMAIVCLVFIIIIVLLIKMNIRYKSLYRRSYKIAIREKNLKADNELFSDSIDPENTYTWFVNLATNIIYYPNGATDLLGKDISSTTMDEFVSRIHIEDKEPFLEKIHQCAIGKSAKFHTTYRIIRPDSKYEYEWWETRGVVTERCYSSGTTYRALSGMSVKVQSYKNIEKKLEDALIKAEKSDNFKSEFIANMSHEIRTPLNAVVGFSELIGKAKTEEQRQEFCDIIKTNSKMLYSLMDEILELSKIESGRIEYNPTTFDFNELFQEMYQSFKVIVPINIKLKCHILPQPLFLNFDRKRLSQVLNNFLSNAVKYTQVGSITMKCRQKDGGVEFSITDTGTGILEEEKGKVFGRFEKFNHKVQGTGLGLAICKSIIEKCGGKIGFDSEYGKGSNFWAWIPCNNTEAPIDNNRVENTVKVSIKGLRILVADDVKSNYTLLAANLRGNTIDYAVNGAEAIMLAQENKYDCIFMDLKMPVVDGFDATKQIRIFNQDVPIVAITAEVFDNYRRLAFDAGCSDFITKPVSNDTLKKILKRCIPSLML